MKRLLAVTVAAALVLPACTGRGGAEPRAAAPTPSPSPSPSPSPVINPPGIVVHNVAFGRSKTRLNRAIADLKKVDLWYPLTKHLFQVKLASRLGVTNIPDDGHLADAVLTAAIEDDAQGRLCDLMFFPNAIAQDLDRWRLYYSQGAVVDPPPTLRQFWGALLAHELGHCFPGGPGEKVAERWEAMAMERLQKLSQ
ncbi:MAG TPA: hypothetical protein VG318_07205 [Actinomycetota bacterium]|nr:hypothetical protein [Actinomycetota bacterium]